MKMHLSPTGARHLLLSCICFAWAYVRLASCRRGCASLAFVLLLVVVQVYADSSTTRCGWCETDIELDDTKVIYTSERYPGVPDTRYMKLNDPDNWIPVTLQKTVLSGELRRMALNVGWMPSWNELDWNLIVLPDVRSRGKINELRGIHRGSMWTRLVSWIRCEEWHTDEDQFCFEAEVTTDTAWTIAQPDFEFDTTGLGSVFSAIEKDTNYLRRDFAIATDVRALRRRVYCYGQFVTEAYHASRPEIHPMEAVWFKRDCSVITTKEPCSEQYVLNIFKDNQRAFRRYVAQAYPHDDTRENKQQNVAFSEYFKSTQLKYGVTQLPVTPRIMIALDTTVKSIDVTLRTKGAIRRLGYQDYERSSTGLSNIVRDLRNQLGSDFEVSSHRCQIHGEYAVITCVLGEFSRSGVTDASPPYMRIVISINRE